MNLIRFFANLVLIFFSQLTHATDNSAEQRYHFQFLQNQSVENIHLVDGLIPTGPIGSSAEKSFGLVERAHLILNLDPSLNIFNDEEKNKILTFNQIYNNTIAPFYLGRNSLVRQMKFDLAKNGSGQKINPTLDEVVRSELFLSREIFKGGLEQAFITAETSMSPLRMVLGAGSRRVNHWPWFYGVDSTRPVLTSLRISQMIDPQGVVRAIEVIARDQSFEQNSDLQAGWEPFVFEQRWGRWFPSTHVKNVAVENFCMRCHVAQDGRFSPYPKNVPDAQTFKNIGYIDEALIDKIMQYKQ